MKLEHVAINVSDPQAAARWYSENLDLRLVSAAEQAPFPHFLADEAGSMLEMYNNPQGAVPDYSQMSPFSLHLAFTTDDIGAMRERLVNAGAEAEGDTLTTPVGDKLAFVRDPWGVPLQLVSRAKPL